MGQASDAAGFGAALRQLHLAAGKPTYAKLVHQASMQDPKVTLDAATLSGWFRAERPSIPRDRRALQFLVTYLQPIARERSNYQPRPSSVWEAWRRRAWDATHVDRGGRPRKSAELDLSGASTVAAGERTWSARLAWTVGGVLVADADMRSLGVHEAISVEGASDETPPTYVERDIDLDGSGRGLRQRLGIAASRGGFVLLVGDSSTGKTRATIEALRTVVPDWLLLHPESAEEIRMLADEPQGRLVVWLDELQKFLDGPGGLGAATLRRLLAAPDPVIVVGTLWSDRWDMWTAVPAAFGKDVYCQERELVQLATMVRVRRDSAQRNLIGPP
jgi:hypothetical protein